MDYVKQNRNALYLRKNKVTELILTQRVGLHVGWAGLLLIGFPLIANQSLPFLLLYISDLGYTLIASATFVLGWSLVRMVLVTSLSQKAKFPL